MTRKASATTAASPDPSPGTRETVGLQQAAGTQADRIWISKDKACWLNPVEMPQTSLVQGMGTMPLNGAFLRPSEACWGVGVRGGNLHLLSYP